MAGISEGVNTHSHKYCCAITRIPQEHYHDHDYNNTDICKYHMSSKPPLTANDHQPINQPALLLCGCMHIIMNVHI
jgi:hypothetical protein